jgi:hypothetical protein
MMPNPILTEHARWSLMYMFRNMTAWGVDWTILWTHALDEAKGDLNDAFDYLEDFTTRREQRSINSALYKAGFSQRMEYNTEND